MLPHDLPPGDWAVCAISPNYAVSTAGEVYSLPRTDACGRRVGGRMLKQHMRRKYKAVPIDGKMYAVHRLVLHTFVRPPREGEVARHLNDLATDNRLENLAWGTYRDNAADRKRNGSYRKRDACLRGHPYTQANTWLTREGWQQCRRCHRERARGWAPAQKPTRKYAPYRSLDAAMKAARAENRRFDIARRLVRMRELSDQGFNASEIGSAVGLHPASVSRYLTLGRNP